MSQTQWDSWYDLRRWRKRRRAQLLRQPLCKLCLEHGVVTVATVVDHVTPHRGDWNAFWLGELQSLCKLCHDKAKRYVETRGYDPLDVGHDGWPLDPRHPANRGTR